MGLFTPMKIGFEKGKAVMVPMKKKEKKPEIHYHYIYETIHKVASEEPIRVARDREFDYGECGNCGKRWYEEFQEVCEGCGVDLSRM